MEDLFDATMAINATLGDQIHNLQARGNDIDSSLKLNQNNAFEKYKKKLTYLLETNNNIDTLKEQVKNIINYIRKK